jgi:integrase/recombinase XerC
LLSCFSEQTLEDIRNRALLATYMATGLRLMEVLELTLSNLDRVYGDITVIAKGGKTAASQAITPSLKYVRAYLQERPRTDSDRVWVQADGRPLSLWGAHSIMRHLREQSRIKRVHWHLFRHGFAKAALKKGAHLALSRRCWVMQPAP